MRDENGNKIKTGGMVEKRHGSDIILDIIVYVILILCTFAFFIPLWHVLMSSFSTGNLLIAKEGIVWWPVNASGAGWNFGAYKLLLEYDGILTGYMNTLIFVICGTLLGLVLNVIGGYCMSRKSGLQSFFVTYVLITLLFNGGMIPTYMVVNALGLVNTRFSIIFLTCTNAMYMMLAMNAYKGVNKAYIEAAEIDGAGHFTVMFRIMLPQCMSMFSVIILFTVVQIWNGWFESKIYTPYDRDLWPLMLWINQIQSDTENFGMELNPDWDEYVLTYSLIVVSIVPVIVIATVFQKYIERGVLIGGVKE